MKKLSILFALLLGAFPASAAPFLSADPFPANGDMALNVVSFVITFQAPTGLSPVSVQAQIGTSGAQYLFYDLAPLTNASYTVTVAAVNGYLQEGPQSDPFTFQKGVPAKITGLKIQQSIPSPLP